MYLNEEDQPRNRDFYMDRTREINELVGYINYLEKSISQIMQKNQTAGDYINNEIVSGNFFNRLQDAKDRLREAKLSLDRHREDRERIEKHYYDDSSFRENEEPQLGFPHRDLENDDQVRLKFVELKDVVLEFRKKLDEHEENMQMNFEGSSKYAYCDEINEMHGLAIQLANYCDDCYSGLRLNNEREDDFLRKLSMYVSKAKSGIIMFDSITADLQVYNPELVGHETETKKDENTKDDFSKKAIDLVRQKCSPEKAKEFEKQLEQNQSKSEQTRKQTLQKFMFSTQDERVDLSHNVARNFLEFGRDSEGEIKREIRLNSRNTNITEEDISKLCEEVAGQLMQCATRNVPTIRQAIINIKQQTKE